MPHKVKRCRVLCRVLFGETYFNCNTYRFVGTTGSVICNLYCQYVPKWMHRALFVCDFQKDLRQKYWSIIKDTAPENLYVHMMSQDTKDRVVSILHCFNSSPIQEWMTFYNALIDFVFFMYINRSKLK